MAEKILIVDDEEDVRRLIRMSLEEQGYDLHEAEDGNRALNMAKELKPDLVILDLMMPDKWGYAVCDELKKDPLTSGTIILFLTARVSTASKKMGEIKGGDDFMVKPFQPGELREKVRNLLDKRSR